MANRRGGTRQLAGRIGIKLITPHHLRPNVGNLTGADPTGAHEGTSASGPGQPGA